MAGSASFPDGMAIASLTDQMTVPTTAKVAADNRLKMLDAAMKRHRHQPDSLIEILHSAQELFGYLDTDCLKYVGRCLKVPPSRVYGVATFYNIFSLKPRGEHTCVVCMGTACYVKGSTAILTAIERTHHVEVGGTTRDGTLSLVTARCLGACGLGPALVLDDDIAGGMTPETALARIEPWTHHDR
jgi:bidirectional [NiFe] hydrogenase diaphorase subunit